MRTTKTFSPLLRRFRHDQSGNFAIMMGILLPVLVVAGGFGVNTAQMLTSKNRLAHALDSALTSTARDITTGTIDIKDAKKVATIFLEANGAGGFFRTDSIHFDSFDVDKSKGTITATASADIDFAIPVFSLGNDYEVTAKSASLYSDKRVEIAMMLDATGSMAGQKLKDLKTAANRAIESLLGNQVAGNDRIRISVIPYADAVNAGAFANVIKKESNSNGQPQDEDDDDAGGGVTLISNDDDDDDDSGPFKGCSTERKGGQQFTDAGPKKAKVNRDSRLVYCPTTQLRPLTSDKDALQATVNSFVANGFTAGHIGIQWSWYMLSPNWSEVLPASAKPGSYKDEKVEKYAILMTDGAFNTAFAGVGPTEKTRGSQGKKSRNYAEKLCKQMKKKGIEVFTIGFKLNSNSARNVMKNCASPDSGSIKHYYDTSSGAELDEAFQAIARNIERLALTE